MLKLGAKELRTTEPTEEELKKIKRNPIYLVLDNVLDTYNVGALFRLADAVAAEKIYLCGQTETPPNPKIKKASVSTWKWVPWEYSKSALSVVNSLKKKSVQIICVEQKKEAISYKDLQPKFPVAVVVGNETYGISKSVLEKADVIVELPMLGINRSLNVMVSAGIILYKIVEHLKK
ncbi:MAG: TrmH family RNA methyltransferase [Patescibacteria group bacterium]